MGLPDLTHALTIVAEIVAAFAVVGGVFYKQVRGVWRLARKVNQFLDDWRGQDARPGFPGRAGVPERLARVEAEVKANGGKSIKDVVTRVESKLDAHIEETTGDGH